MLSPDLPAEVKWKRWEKDKLPVHGERSFKNIRTSNFNMGASCVRAKNIKPK